MKAINELKEKLSNDPALAKLQDRYQKLSSREQLIVKVVALVLVLVVVLQLTLVPLYNENRQLQSDLDKQLELYNRMADNGYRFNSATGLTTSNRPLLNEVTRLSKNRGVTLSRYEQDNSGLRVWFDNTIFDDAASLLQDLSKVGIMTNQINVDRQDQAGRVNIRATLSR